MAEEHNVQPEMINEGDNVKTLAGKKVHNVEYILWRFRARNTRHLVTFCGMVRRASDLMKVRGPTNCQKCLDRMPSERRTT